MAEPKDSNIIPLKPRKSHRIGHTVELHYTDDTLAFARVFPDPGDRRMLADELERVARSLRQQAQDEAETDDDVIATVVIRRSSQVSSYIFGGVAGSRVSEWLKRRLDQAKRQLDDL